MRIRTPALLATVVVTAVAAVSPAGPQLASSSAAAAPSPAAGAVAELSDALPRDAADPSALVDVCPPAKAPLVSCFAKYRPGARTLAADGPVGFGPSDLRAAYSLPETGGADQLVAVVVAFSNPKVEADLAEYRAQYGLPACTTASGCLKIVNQDGAASPLPEPNERWGLEMALDLDMVSAICPRCELLLVQARTNGLDDLGKAVDTAVRLGANVVSNSYGTNVEFASELDYERHYNHPGHAIVASAGDLGYSVSFPAASRYVTSVGGTALRKRDGGWSETVWSGTGSGCSAYVKKPAWQDDKNCPMRMVADIAAVADPATGVAVRSTFGGSGWMSVGGTSASAPIIAAIYALTGTANKVDDGSTPWKNRNVPGAFRDIVSGQNVPSAFAQTCGGDYLCTGVVGYDGPTGWGTPIGLAGLTVR